MNDHDHDAGFFTVRVPLSDFHRAVAGEIDYERLAREMLRLQEGERIRRTPFLTVPEAAEFLRVAEQTIRNELTARTFTRHKVGGRTLLSRAEVERHVVVDRPRRERTSALMSATTWAAG